MVVKGAAAEVWGRGAWSCLVPEPQTWVKLWQPPNAYAHDEALLECRHEDGRWAAWIPDFGPIDLNPEEFCRLH
ncbi:MAG: hypothetical protein HC918_11425 [Oscillatoriales cyanobacterium SM2_1_8]|nr:hypothetical protein [Oscillatoriales cyanobacterium SM2_1_8]